MTMKNHFFILTLLALGAWSCNDDPVQPELFGNIHGVVQDVNGTPLVGVQISTSPTTVTVSTDSMGAFAIDSILVQSYALTAQKDGFRDRTQSVAMEDEGTVMVTVTMSEQTESNDPPEKPILLEPESDAEGVERNPVFRWTASDPEGDALTYTVVWFNDESRDSVVTTDTIAQGAGLRLEETFFWYVVADDGNNTPITSSIQSFTTKDFPDFSVHLVKENPSTGNLVIFAAEDPPLDVDDDFNTDSVELIPLTDPNIESWRPRMNPQGTRIAFLSRFNGDIHLFLMDRNGDNISRITPDNRPLTGKKAFELSYAWSPDGSQIAYPSNDDLVILTLGGQGGSNFTTVFAEADPDYDYIEVDWMDAGGVPGGFIGARMQTTDLNKSKIYVYNPDGSPVHGGPILDNGTNSDGQLSGPVMATDGTIRFYFTEDETGTLSEGLPKRSRIRVINFQVPGIPPSKVDTGDEFTDTNDLFPCTSVGGGRIMFVNISNSTSSKIGNIYLVDVQDSQSQRILLYRDATMPDWQ